MRLNHFNWRKDGNGAPSPGEPLFSLGDCAARVGRTLPQVTALAGHHPGLKPWRTRGSAGVRQQTLYRMSDFMRWYASLPV
ncbi:hypothetical protein D3C87_848090 [compost metagenome]